MVGIIIGNQNPLLGTTYHYEIKPFGLSFGSQGKYEWYLYKKQKNGIWKDITGNPKTGEKVTYRFGEPGLGIEFEMKVYETKPGILPGMSSTKQLVGSMKLIPTSNKVPKIDKVVLFNRGAKDVNKANYRDTLIAQAHCIAMFNKEIEFHLWEDDAPGKGHDPNINKNNRHTRTYKARVNEKGIAEIGIPLMSDEKILRQMANKFLMKGDQNEGANHEYYVTASYSGKIQGASQTNVDVANPDYKTGQPTPKSEPQKNTPKFPAGQGGGPKQSDPKGNIIEAVFINDAGTELSKVRVEDKVRVRVHTKNMVGKHIQYVIWEYDMMSHDEIYRSPDVKIAADIYDSASFTITKDVFKKGIDSLIPNDPDEKKQNYFIEIISKDLSAESKKFGVDSEGLLTVESPLSPSGVQNTPKPEAPKTNCICQEQYKDLAWGGKVSCEFRKKVIEIAKQLWGEANKMKMASELMICMAVETGERFSPDYGYPNATGLIQFTGTAIKDMNNTGYNGGKQIDKKYISSLTAEKQLEYVKLYFQMWMEKYKKTINDALDMYLTIWCPAGVGKADTFVCYSEEKDKKDGVDYYEKNKSIEYEYYDDKEPISRKRLKKDPTLGNKKLEKGDLKPRFKFWTVLGSENKVKNFTCNKEAAKQPESTNNSKIVYFDPGLTEDRVKVVSQFTISLLEKAAKGSANEKLIITSTIRSTRKQAEVMYQNESNGMHISYALPGKEVIAVFNAGRKKGDSKEKVISDMDNKIKDLSKEGRRVSLHCVSVEVYKKNNIIDISYTRGIKNPRDLIKELVKDPAVTKIIHPLNNVIAHPKIKYDAKEPAIHVETKVP